MSEPGPSSPDTTDQHPIRLRYRHVQIDPPGQVTVCRTWPPSLQRALAEIIADWFRQAMADGQVSSHWNGTIPAIRGATRCDLFGDGELPIATGFAFCSARDQFCRRTGRLIAFGRASRPGRHTPSPA